MKVTSSSKILLVMVVMMAGLAFLRMVVTVIHFIGSRFPDAEDIPVKVQGPPGHDVVEVDPGRNFIEGNDLAEMLLSVSVSHRDEIARRQNVLRYLSFYLEIFHRNVHDVFRNALPVSIFRRERKAEVVSFFQSAQLGFKGGEQLAHTE